MITLVNIFSTKETVTQSKLELSTTDIVVDGELVVPTNVATHVGVVRSVSGNSHNIATRLTAHRRAFYALMHTGLAKSHRANPAATLRVESVYGLYVLLSGKVPGPVLQSPYPKNSQATSSYSCSGCVFPGWLSSPKCQNTLTHVFAIWPIVSS